jgi:hypothetical protein
MARTQALAGEPALVLVVEPGREPVPALAVAPVRAEPVRAEPVQARWVAPEQVAQLVAPELVAARKLAVGLQ